MNGEGIPPQLLALLLQQFPQLQKQMQGGMPSAGGQGGMPPPAGGGLPQQIMAPMSPSPMKPPGMPGY